MSMHLILMFQLCIAQPQNQTGHKIQVEGDLSHFKRKKQRLNKEKQQDTVIGLSCQEKSISWHQILDYTESPVHLHKPNKVDVTQEIIRSRQTVVRQKPPTPSILRVLRDPQCERRPHISPAVSSNNKVLTAKKSSQMVGLPFFFLSFNNEK